MKIKIKNKIIISAFILTIAGLLTRVLGFVHRIFMTNIIGAEGIGLYQLVFPIYSLAWAITCAGFTTAVSKLAAAAKAKREYEKMKSFMVYAVLITGLLAVILSMGLFFSAELIANYIFNEPRIALGLKTLSFAIPFMAMGSSLRGYFFGIQEAKIPAISQIIEQIMRMFLIYVLSRVYFGSIETAVALAVAGIAAGEVVSFLYVFFAYKDKYGTKANTERTAKKHFRKSRNKDSYNKRKVDKAVLTTLLAMSVPLGLSRISGSLLSTVENILIPSRLELYGIENAVEEFGKLTGMAMPLIQFPSAVLMALSISLVPAISEASELKNYNQINEAVKKTMLFSMVIGIGAAAGFILFGDTIGKLIYSYDLSHILKPIGFLVPFIYANMLLMGILNGLGLQGFIFKNSLVYSIISIAGVYFLIPRIGILGYIIAIGVGSVLLFCLNLNKIHKIANLKIDFLNWAIKPLFAVFIAAGVLGFVEGFILRVLVFGVVYLGMVYGFLKNQLQLR
ncbi:MAG: polysaccharide biosynthesis protein [Defluviitaleaceae bacterium]|nr:polysaccharide biosynthesis protein [Defluviitaleaceae bacterium]